MVERFNCSLLQLLRTYVDKQEDWEQYLPLVLYAYHTETHASTGCSPFMLMFGRQLSLPAITQCNSFDATSYADHARAKLAELRDLVEANTVEVAERQKLMYDLHTKSHSFKEGDAVWLSVPTAGKLEPRWEGGWKVTKIKSPVNVQISSGHHSKMVQVNRLHHWIQPNLQDKEDAQTRAYQWNPPQAEHTILPPLTTPARRYPLRQ